MIRWWRRRRAEPTPAAYSADLRREACRIRAAEMDDDRRAVLARWAAEEMVAVRRIENELRNERALARGRAALEKRGQA